MPQYSIETKVLITREETRLVLRPVQADVPEFENQHLIEIFDLRLLHGELIANRDVCLLRSSSTHLVFWFTTADVNVAVEQLVLANETVEKLSAEFQSHMFNEYRLKTLDSNVISLHLRKLSELTEEFGAILADFEYNTNNGVGSIYRQYVDVDHGDDLEREYQFRGGVRKLVFPKLGNYQAIDLPHDLRCGSPLCSYGKIYRLVERMNRIMVKVDWHCLQIAHKMKDHQDTDTPNGPYWVINPE